MINVICDPRLLCKAMCSALFVGNFHSHKWYLNSQRKTFTLQSLNSCCQKSADDAMINLTVSIFEVLKQLENIVSAFINMSLEKHQTVTEIKKDLFDLK